jgi:hypothetical protein
VCECLRRHLEKSVAELCKYVPPPACPEVELMSYRERGALQQEYEKIIKTYIEKECRG